MRQKENLGDIILDRKMLNITGIFLNVLFQSNKTRYENVVFA
jgi:hypothetical protein